MEAWLTQLKFNPIPKLLEQQNQALLYFVHRDVLGEKTPPIEILWALLEPNDLFRKQTEKGSWQYPLKSKSNNPVFNYDLLETYRNLRILVEMYGLDKKHPVIQNTAEFVFSCQSEEGDIRGILGNQYMPYYHAAILEELIKAGYGEDPRVIKGLDWLLAMRQQDGGWIIPFQGVPAKQKRGLWESDPLPPNRALPFSHLANGMILRAYAIHSSYSRRPEIRKAGELLLSRFFKPDKYSDRKGGEYWTKFQYPFFWTSLLTALDTLWHLGFTIEEEGIRGGLDWFIENQLPDGSWQTEYNKGVNANRTKPWVTLAICRILKAFFK